MHWFWELSLVESAQQMGWNTKVGKMGWNTKVRKMGGNSKVEKMGSRSRRAPCAKSTTAREVEMSALLNTTSSLLMF